MTTTPASLSAAEPSCGVYEPGGFDAYDAADAAEYDALPYPRPLGPRCQACGYRDDALGHLSKCERGRPR